MRHIDNKDRQGPKAARNYVIWLVLWIVIDFVIITWILMFPPERNSSFDLTEAAVRSREAASSGVTETQADAGRGRPIYPSAPDARAHG